MDDEKRGPPEQEQFHAKRSRGIGGSDAAVILGLSAWKTPLQLYYEKRNELEHPPEDDEREELEWGHRLEPVIINTLHDRTGRLVVHHSRESGFRRHKRIEWLLCHLDGEYWTGERTPGYDRADGIVEAKNVTGWKVDDWGIGPPLYVQVQVQHCMAVTNLPSAAVAALIGGNRFRHFDIEPNVRFIRAMLDKESEFWHRVQVGREPTAQAADSKFLAQYLKVSPKTVVTLPGEAIRLDQMREHAAAQVKKWAAIKDGTEARIKQLIGTNEKGNLTNGVSYTFSEVAGGEVSYYRKPSRKLTRRGRK